MDFVEVGIESPLWELAQGIPTALSATATRYRLYDFEAWWGGPREMPRAINFVDAEGRHCTYALDGYGTLQIQYGYSPSEDGLAFWEAAKDQLSDKIKEAMDRHFRNYP